MTTSGPTDRPRIPAHLLRGYSRGQVTRREIAERMGAAVTFGSLLEELQRAGLPLPRIPSDPRSDGVLLVRDLTQRAMARAG